MPEPKEEVEKPAETDPKDGEEKPAASGEETGSEEKQDETAAEPTADPLVAKAFAMGWQMAALYRKPARVTPPSDEVPADNGLPGLSGLDDGARAEIFVLEVEATLSSMKKLFKALEVEPPSTGDLQKEMKKEGPNGQLKDDVRNLHIAILGRLTAIDFRLGKAYGLGRALSETSVFTDLPELKEKLNEYRVAQMNEWLADLASVLPAHASRATQISLEVWSAWAQNVDESKGGAQKTETKRALTRQGKLWRALLSGEKKGTDMLDIDDYTDAADRLMKEGKGIFKRVTRQYERYLAPLAAIVVALALIAIFDKDANSLVVAIGGAAAALGVSWKGIGTLLSDLAGKLKKPLWDAELDRAIAAAITVLPGGAKPTIDPSAVLPIGPTLAPRPPAPTQPTPSP